MFILFQELQDDDLTSADLYAESLASSSHVLGRLGAFPDQRRAENEL